MTGRRQYGPQGRFVRAPADPDPAPIRKDQFNACCRIARFLTDQSECGPATTSPS
jgi:hypothetical protein